MDEDIAPVGGDKTLTFLKWLVTTLTITMIVGCVAVVTLLVMHFTSARNLDLPEEIVLPDGARATAFTQGDGWFAVVTEDQTILIYSRATGTLLQTVEIQSE